MEPSPPAVLARDVGFAYGDHRALDGVGFQVERGEIFGFLGPNGGGKTTLFRILATLLPLQEGEVEIFGVDRRRDPAEVRRRLGVVFQSPSLDLQLTVAENLRHQGHLYGLLGGGLAERSGELLARFGLSERRDALAGALSGGLRRRLEIAKALLHRPPLLLLDEPSTGLDPAVRREVWNVLEGLAGDDGVTVLLTTHFMEEGDRCHRLALVDGGRVVAHGSPDGLKEEIGGDVVTVEGDDPRELADALAARFEVEPWIDDDGAVRFERERAHELVGRVGEALAGRLRSLTVARPTLEDVFLQRTGHGLAGRLERGPAGGPAGGPGEADRGEGAA